MDKSIIEALKGKTREERAAFFKENKAELLKTVDLEAVNGGAETTLENPDSEVPYDRKWYSSFGYVCAGEYFCD